MKTLILNRKDISYIIGVYRNLDIAQERLEYFKKKFRGSDIKWEII